MILKTFASRLNVFLGHLNLGERTIKGCLEAYSCKKHLFVFSLSIIVLGYKENKLKLFVFVFDRQTCRK
jgi:hypothetical protein